MRGDLLALAGVAAVALASSSRRGSAAGARSVGRWSRLPADLLDGDLRELELALDRAARGSRNGKEEPTVRGRKPSVAQAFLRLEPTLVPDELLVAVILSGATRRSPREVARDLILEARGDLARVHDRAVFRPIRGVGESGRARLLAASELYRRAAYRGAAEVAQITDPESAIRLLRTMATGPYEQLVALYLDNRGRLLGSRVLTRGSLGFTIVDPRQVFRPAVELGASAVILAHQHPSGDATPSGQDIRSTRRTVEAGKALGLPLQDHLVITPTSYTSLREGGYVGF